MIKDVLTKSERIESVEDENSVNDVLKEINFCCKIQVLIMLAKNHYEQNGNKCTTKKELIKKFNRYGYQVIGDLCDLGLAKQVLAKQVPHLAESKENGRDKYESAVEITELGLKVFESLLNEMKVETLFE